MNRIKWTTICILYVLFTWDRSNIYIVICIDSCYNIRLLDIIYCKLDASIVLNRFDIVHLVSYTGLLYMYIYIYIYI